MLYTRVLLTLTPTELRFETGAAESVSLSLDALQVQTHHTAPSLCPLHPLHPLQAVVCDLQTFGIKLSTRKGACAAQGAIGRHAE